MKNPISSVIIIITTIVAMVYGGFTIAAGSDKDRYIVSFQDVVKGKSALRASGSDVLLDLPNQGAVAALIPVHALKGLRRNPNIEYIETDALRYPMSQTMPWGIRATGANLLDDYLTGDTMVCIIDSGYSNGHEDLPVLGAGDATPDLGTEDPLATSTICHHGTHVAGTIAALSNDVGVMGVNPNGKVSLHIIKVFEDDPSSASGCGWGYSSDLVAALDACVAAGSGMKTIINMSLGGPTKNRTELRAFSNAYNNGVLSIAAAGNDGNTRHSYPASYDSVVSVAAVDSALTVADFSQQTNQVELSGPGVAIRSTVTMGTGMEENLTVGGVAYEATGMEGSADSSATAVLFRCNATDGLGTPGDCAGAAEKVCLISRGVISFAEKAVECENQGGVGVVIFNDAPALFSGTFGETSVSIPTVGVSGTDGAVLEAAMGQVATVTTTSGNYAFYDGTSMATPHVAGIAALVWSHDLNCSNSDIRTALASSATDLGPAGRDNAYGYGLVQAADALLALDCDGGGGVCTLLPTGASCTTDAECCSNACKGKPGSKTCK